jgi:acetylglutamate kinase
MKVVRKVRGELAVVKIGGEWLKDTHELEGLGRYAQAVLESGLRVVLVHGGGREVAELREAVSRRRVRGDNRERLAEQNIRLATMVLCGLVNKRVVARLVASGLPALGLSGVDHQLLRANFLNRDKLGRVGGPPRVDTVPMRRFLDSDLVPVLAPICLGPDGDPVVVDADAVAHALAVSLEAVQLDFICDDPGLTVEGSGILRRLAKADLEQMLAERRFSGRVIPKLQAALAAVDSGVKRVRIGDLAGMQRDEVSEVVGATGASSGSAAVGP